jgi:hypothetical protein
MKAFMTDSVVRAIAMVLVLVMGVVSLVPRVEASFVSSDQSSAPISRQEDMGTIQKALEQKLVKERLKDLGYTEEEIKTRLDRLSDSELHSVATQIDTLMPAGSTAGVLVVILAVAILVVLILMWTGTSPPITQSKEAAPEAQKVGFLGEYYKYLQPGPEGGAKMRWLEPGVDFSKYNKIMLDRVTFFFAADSESKDIDPAEMKALEDSCNQQLVNTLKASYPIVTEPGPDVVRLRLAITDLKQSRPLLSACTSVIPISLGISTLKKATTGSWTGSGATSAEFMAIDSMSGNVIAVAQDEKSAGFTERFTKWGSAEDAFKFWAERIKLFMDQAHSVKQ